MQEGGRKVEATCSKCFHNTLWNKIGSDRTSWYIDGIIHSVFTESLTVSHLHHSDTQIQTICCFSTEVHRLSTLVGSVRYLITFLKYTLFYYIVQLYPTISHCWAIANPNTFLRYTPSYYIAEHFPISIHCWAITSLSTLSNYGRS